MLFIIVQWASIAKAGGERTLHSIIVLAAHETRDVACAINFPHLYLPF